MKRLTVSIPGREYEILSEPGLLDKAGQILHPALGGRLAVVITDSNVEPLYGTRVLRSLHLSGYETAELEVPAGEKSKCPEVLAELWEQLMDVGLTRSDLIVALGGGVVGDLSGFAAATILRGVNLVQIPTTLLAQVDSSVGGKVAIDLNAGKNLAGAFYQPKMVLMDPACLKTLPDRVFSDGMAEVIKYGCIRDRQLFDWLDQLGSRETVMEHMEEISYRCYGIKARIVEQDEMDTGLRMILNFGHTLGHVYEKAGNYETWTHGEAVAAGMVAAARLGQKLGITPAGTEEKIAALLEKFDLPTKISVREADYSETLGKDKKSQGTDINLVVLKELGQAETVKLSQAELLALIRDYLREILP